MRLNEFAATRTGLAVFSVKLLLPAVIFITFFAYAYLRVAYYTPISLKIFGQAKNQSKLLVDWDSGYGFNPLERRELPIQELRKHHVKVVRKRDNAESSVADVWIENISTDLGESLDLIKLSSRTGVVLDRHLEQPLLRLTEASSDLEFYKKFNSLTISFLANAHSGHAAVYVDGTLIEEIELYHPSRESRVLKVSPNTRAVSGTLSEQVPFGFKIDLSPQKISHIRLKFEGAAVISKAALEGNGHTQILNLPTTSQNGMTLAAGGNPINLAFNPILFYTQICFAAIATLIFLVLTRNWDLLRSLITAPLSRAGRFFYASLAISLSVYSLWLLAYWPVAFSPDSLFTWTTSRHLNFYDDSHPFLNVFYVLLLRQIWDHPAVISLFQIIATSFLGCAIFSYTFYRRAPLFIVGACFFLFALSVPVGLYNITLWRDTLFALIMTLLAFLLFVLKDSPYIRNRFGWLEILLLCIATIFLLVRHNGKITVIALPLMILFLGLLPWRKAVGYVLLTGMLYYFTQQTLRLDLLGIHFLYRSEIIQTWQENLRIENIPSQAARTARRYLNTLDINLNKKETNLWKHTYGNLRKADGFSYTDDIDAGYIEYRPVSPKIRSVLDKIAFEKSYESPWINFTWNPFYFLYLFLVPLIFPRHLPRSAIYSIVFVSQTVALIYLTDSINWRYFYFQCFGGYFLLPLIASELKQMALRRRQILSLVSLFSLFISVAVLELLFGDKLGDRILKQEISKDFGPRYPAAYSDYLPFTTPRNHRFIFGSEDQEMYYNFEESGLRSSVSFSLQPKPGHRRILMIGDSYLLGWGVPEKVSFAGQLQQKFSDQGLLVEVLNAGYTSGYSPDSYYAYLKREGLSFSPDLIVLVVTTYNDVEDIQDNVWRILDATGLPSKLNTLRAYPDFNGDLLNPDILPWNYHLPLFSQSKIFVSSANLLNRLFFNIDLDKVKVGKPISQDEAFERFSLSLGGIRQIAAHHNIQLVALIIEVQGKKIVTPQYLDRLNSILGQSQIPLIDARPKLTADHVLSELDKHLNFEGNRIVCELLWRYLEDKFLPHSNYESSNQIRN